MHNLRTGSGLLLRVGEEGEGAFGGERIDVCVYFLGIKEDPGEGRREVERAVSRIVGSEDEGICEGGGGEGGGEEGFVVDVGGVLFLGGHLEVYIRGRDCAIEML